VKVSRDIFNRPAGGGLYALTVFTPIVPGHEEDVRDVLDALGVGEQDPLARIDGLHFSRLQVFSELVHQGPSQRKVATLQSSYLVFTATIDGEPDPFLDRIRERIPDAADSWWGHCVGYPGTADRDAFVRYLRYNQIDTAFVASPYSGASVEDVRESLALRDRVVEFAADAQGLDAAELQRRFLSEFA
jgi:hypothetical protein